MERRPILLIEPDPDLARRISSEAELRGGSVEIAPTLSDAAARLGRGDRGIVVADLRTSDDSRSAIESLVQRSGNADVVLISRRSVSVIRRAHGSIVYGLIARPLTEAPLPADLRMLLSTLELDAAPGLPDESRSRNE